MFFKLAVPLILSLILVLAAYLRLSHLDYSEFKSDEAAVLGIALSHLENHTLPLVGLKSSVGVFNGSAFIILMAIPLAITRDPVFAASFVALLNVLAVLFSFRFARRYFGVRVALIASLLFATSPWAVVFSRKIWSQDALPLFTILFFAALYSVAVEKRSRPIVLAFLWLSVLIQLHLDHRGLRSPNDLNAAILSPRAPPQPRRVWPGGSFGVVCSLLILRDSQRLSQPDRPLRNGRHQPPARLGVRANGL
jgi:hypothetical protein